MSPQNLSSNSHEISTVKLLQKKLTLKGGITNFDKNDKMHIGRLVNGNQMSAKDLAKTLGIDIQNIWYYARKHSKGARLQRGGGRPRILSPRDVADIDRFVRRQHK